VTTGLNLWYYYTHNNQHLLSREKKAHGRVSFGCIHSEAIINDLSSSLPIFKDLLVSCFYHPLFFSLSVTNYLIQSLVLFRFHHFLTIRN